MRKKILVVDDDPAIVFMVKTRLEANHYIVVTAADGVEALEKVASEKPSLIVLDMAMPRLDGYHFVVELRKKEDPLHPTPVILMTARGTMGDLFDPSELSGVLTKPFEPAKLTEMIQKALKISDEKSEARDKALIIGADWEVTRKIRAVLEEKGMLVRIAQDAPHAIEEMAKFLPDLVFAPTHLTGIDIWEFCNLYYLLPSVRSRPLIVYDSGRLGKDGYGSIQAKHIIDYKTHDDLLEKIATIVKEYL